MSVRVTADNSYVELASSGLALTRFTVAMWVNVDDLSTGRVAWGLGAAGDDHLLGIVDVGGFPAVVSFDQTLGKYRTFTSAVGAAPVGRWAYLVHLVDISAATHDLWSVVDYSNGGLGSLTETPDSGSTGTLLLPASSTFRVGADHEGDSGRQAMAYIRLFDRWLQPPEILRSMWSQSCPERLRRWCLVDWAFESDLVNRGTLAGVGVITGTADFPAGPQLPGGERRTPPAHLIASPNNVVGSASVLSTRRRRAA